MLTQDASNAVHEALASSLGEGFARAAVRFGQDHDGDDALFVRAYLKPDAARPSSEASLQAMVALRSRLLAAGETRRSYLDLDYPTDDHASPEGRAA